MSPSRASWAGPRKAKGAMSAPVLTPVTSLNSGRSPAAVQPTSSPAPKAPSSLPPESARRLAGGRRPLAARPRCSRSRSSARRTSWASSGTWVSAQKRAFGRPSRTVARSVWSRGTADRRGASAQAAAIAGRAVADWRSSGRRHGRARPAACAAGCGWRLRTVASRRGLPPEAWPSRRGGVSLVPWARPRRPAPPRRPCRPGRRRAAFG